MTTGVYLSITKITQRSKANEFRSESSYWALCNRVGLLRKRSCNNWIFFRSFSAWRKKAKDLPAWWFQRRSSRGCCLRMMKKLNQKYKNIIVWWIKNPIKISHLTNSPTQSSSLDSWWHLLLPPAPVLQRDPPWDPAGIPVSCTGTNGVCSHPLIPQGHGTRVGSR